MSHFNELGELPDDEMRVLVWGLTSSTLAMALKTAPPAVTKKFLANMSRGCAGLIEDTMEKLHDVTASQIETEQSVVLKRLELIRANGEIKGGWRLHPFFRRLREWMQ